ncbi:hypothetical protein LIER_20898 [Lithospermum erythrorhizon]|uniref:Uncharacterized protein n=1 Tax=Lithospermum erythrorhizon TaxID=34254 RepID=A0AAV3QRC1_LITER
MLCKEKEGSTVWLLLLLVLGAPLIKCKVKSEIPFKASFKFNQKMILSVASVIWKLTSVKLNGIMTKIGGGGAGGGRKIGGGVEQGMAEGLKGFIRLKYSVF